MVSTPYHLAYFIGRLVMHDLISNHLERAILNRILPLIFSSPPVRFEMSLLEPMDQLASRKHHAHGEAARPFPTVSIAWIEATHVDLSGA